MSGTSIAKKRNSQQHNVDSKYGFAGSTNNGKNNLPSNNNGTQNPTSAANESVDELPLPPHPNGAANIPQQQQAHTTNISSYFRLSFLFSKQKF